MENYQITKDQIRKLTDPQVREWFPEAFENELEVGKWYKHDESGCLVFVEKIIGEDFIGYGFTSSGRFVESQENWTIGFDKWRQATEEEVFEALKNEAVKRGFVEGAMYTNTKGQTNKKVSGLFFGWEGLHSDDGDGMIFNKGKWATIIETITKKEAEKLLNKKIID